MPVDTYPDPARLMEEEGEEMRDRNLALFIVDRSGHVLAQSQNQIPVWPYRGDDWLVRQMPLGKSDALVVLAAPWRETRQELREFALALVGVGVLVVDQP